MKLLLSGIYWALIRSVPWLRPAYLTRGTQTPIPVRQLLAFKLGLRRGVYWPTHPSSVVVDPNRIHIGIETSPALMPGCYIQGTNGIVIGDYTQIASGVSIVSANHSLTDNRIHTDCAPVRIGSHSWIGTNSVILPGVELGQYTVVGAGAVVTKSFIEGYQVLAGNPAKIIRRLNFEECVLHRSEQEFNGFIAASEFHAFRKRYLVSLI